MCAANASYALPAPPTAPTSSRPLAHLDRSRCNFLHSPASGSTSTMSTQSPPTRRPSLTDADGGIGFYGQPPCKEAATACRIDLTSSASVGSLGELPTLLPLASTVPSVHLRNLHSLAADGASGPEPSEHACVADRYRLQPNAFGKGAFGTVRRAVDLHTGELVAIKQVSASMHGATLTAAQEALALSRLHSSPNIIGFREYMRTDAATHMIVMDAATGGDLFAHVIERRRPLSETEARGLFAQMLHGVAQMHTRGVAHRDLKLENAVIDGAGAVRWIDFGLSHVFAKGEPRVGGGGGGVGGGGVWGCGCGAATHEAEAYQVVPLTEPVGSRPYMSPEVAALFRAKTAPPYDAFAADMWALGVCLFGMLHAFFPVSRAETSEPAFTALLDAQAAGKSACRAVCDHYGRPCTLSDDVVGLIDALLSVQPTARPTPEAALCSPWFTRRGGVSGVCSPLTLPPPTMAEQPQLHPHPQLQPQPRPQSTAAAGKRPVAAALLDSLLAASRAEEQQQREPSRKRQRVAQPHSGDYARASDYARTPPDAHAHADADPDTADDDPFAFSLLDACNLFAEVCPPGSPTEP